MKKTLLLSLLALCSLCGAMAQTGNITVTGQVVNRRADAPKSVNLNLCDWFNATTRLNLPLDDDGHFRTQINFPVGHYFTMIYRDFIYAYAEPGDSLHVLIDDSRSEQDKQTVTFSGRNNGLSQLYEDYHQHLTPFIYAQKIPTKKSTLPLDYYLHLVYHTHQKMADSIQSYGRLHQLKDSDIRLLKNNAFFTLTDSYAESCGSNPQERLTFLSHPYFQLDNPDNLCNSLDYGVHLSYITYYFFDKTLFSTNSNNREINWHPHRENSNSSFPVRKASAAMSCWACSSKNRSKFPYPTPRLSSCLPHGNY